MQGTDLCHILAGWVGWLVGLFCISFRPMKWEITTEIAPGSLVSRLGGGVRATGSDDLLSSDDDAMVQTQVFICVML